MACALPADWVAPATPRIKLAFETSPSFAPNTIARRFDPAALRCRRPISPTGRCMGWPDVGAAPYTDMPRTFMAASTRLSLRPPNQRTSATTARARTLGRNAGGFGSR